jgi:hypothetical protein
MATRDAAQQFPWISLFQTKEFAVRRADILFRAQGTRPKTLRGKADSRRAVVATRKFPAGRES